jgi:hypothetical protein
LKLHNNNISNDQLQDKENELIKRHEELLLKQSELENFNEELINKEELL